MRKNFILFLVGLLIITSGAAWLIIDRLNRNAIIPENLHPDRSESWEIDTMERAFQQAPDIPNDEIIGELVKSVNNLAFKSAAHLFPADTTRSAAFSPLGLNRLLTLLGTGAYGESERELARALDLTTDWAALLDAHDRWKGWTDKLESLTIESADALWHDETLTLKPAFMDVSLSSGVTIKPLNPNRTVAVNEINQWASENTHGMIKSIIRDLLEEQALVLANALYFKGTWSEEFQKSKTKSDSFFNASGETQPCHMMTQSGYFNYTETPSAQWLMKDYLPYRGCSMVFALPINGATPMTVMAELNAQQYANVTATLRNSHRKGNIEIPRFSVVSLDNELESLLKALGFEATLTGEDFSGISDELNEGIIAQLKQSVRVDVDESGTEAAAVTLGGMYAGVNPEETIIPFHFRADHPFLFFIQDANSMILFNGVVNTVTHENP